MGTPLKIVFFGTSEFSVAVLEEMEATGFIPAVLITQEDKPQGRNLVLTPSPAKVWAQEHGIEVLEPHKLDGKHLGPILNSEWDLFVVASYGKLIPKYILDLPRHGTLNVHPSLLPKLRGASPVRTAILEGDRSAVGISIIKLDEEMDHGPIVAQARIEPEEWPMGAELLETMLAHEGGKLLSEAIPLWVKGNITPEEQDHEKATFSQKIEKSMGEIDLSGDPIVNLRKIKAFEGWPGTFFFADRNGKKTRVKIMDATLDPQNELHILRVIPEGKKEMDYEDFLRGNN